MPEYNTSLGALRRLEKRGKVKEIHPGWQREKT